MRPHWTSSLNRLRASVIQGDPASVAHEAGKFLDTPDTARILESMAARFLTCKRLDKVQMLIDAGVDANAIFGAASLERRQDWLDRVTVSVLSKFGMNKKTALRILSQMQIRDVPQADLLATVQCVLSAAGSLAGVTGATSDILLRFVELGDCDDIVSILLAGGIEPSTSALVCAIKHDSLRSCNLIARACAATGAVTADCFREALVPTFKPTALRALAAVAPIPIAHLCMRHIPLSVPMLTVLLDCCGVRVDARFGDGLRLLDCAMLQCTDTNPAQMARCVSVAARCQRVRCAVLPVRVSIASMRCAAV